MLLDALILPDGRVSRHARRRLRRRVALEAFTGAIIMNFQTLMFIAMLPPGIRRMLPAPLLASIDIGTIIGRGDGYRCHA